VCGWLGDLVFFWVLCYGFWVIFWRAGDFFRIKEEKIDQGTPGRNLKREYHESFLTPGFFREFFEGNCNKAFFADKASSYGDWTNTAGMDSGFEFIFVRDFCTRGRRTEYIMTERVFCRALGKGFWGELLGENKERKNEY
jgi:hypothetical protein